MNSNFQTLEVLSRHKICQIAFQVLGRSAFIAALPVTEIESFDLSLRRSVYTFSSSTEWKKVYLRVFHCTYIKTTIPVLSTRIFVALSFKFLTLFVLKSLARLSVISSDSRVERFLFFFYFRLF